MKIQEVRAAVFDFLNPLGMEADVFLIGREEIMITPNTSKVGNLREGSLDNMQINYWVQSGTFEVAEVSAGVNKDEIWIYRETNSLKSALKELVKGNRRNPIKRW